jgi:bifunctional UDP-N-acetylglucosamine pyrophosphorylase/glucosamine-1-phosphate N-acetyltransferase
MAELAAYVAPAEVAVQESPQGTGHAVLAARKALAGFSGDVVVLFGDTPLLTAETVERVIAARRGPGDPAVAVLGFRPSDPSPYGRLITAADGTLERIVEARDASAAERAIPLCNAGIMAFDGAVLFDFLARIGNDNAKHEYYLTDIVAVARQAGRRCVALGAADADEVMGVNTRAELAVAEAVMQTRLRARAMAGGVTMTDPSTVYLSHDTTFGRDVTVGRTCSSDRASQSPTTSRSAPSATSKGHRSDRGPSSGRSRVSVRARSSAPRCTSATSSR